MPASALAILLYLPADQPAPVGLIEQYVRPGDLVVLDLEESVKPENAETARGMLSSTCDALSDCAATVAVRPNALDTDDGKADLAVIATLPNEVAVIVPKPVTAETLAAAHEPSRPLICMGEEVGFETRLPDLHRASPLSAIIIGAKDLSESLGIAFDLDADALRAAASTFKDAAQSLGIRAFDAVAFGRDGALEKRMARAQSDGFDGVSLMRPKDLAARP